MKLTDALERRGVKLTPKLRYQITDGALDAATLALLKANRDELLRDLMAPDSIPRLPWQLEQV